MQTPKTRNKIPGNRVREPTFFSPIPHPRNPVPTDIWELLAGGWWRSHEDKLWGPGYLNTPLKTGDCIRKSPLIKPRYEDHHPDPSSKSESLRKAFSLKPAGWTSEQLSVMPASMPALGKPGLPWGGAKGWNEVLPSAVCPGCWQEAVG